MASSVSDYISSTDLCGILPYIPTENFADSMWGEEIFPYYFFGNGGINNTMPPETETVSAVVGKSYPERLGISVMDVAKPALAEFDMGLCGIIPNGIQSFGGAGYDQPDIFEVGEKCNGFASDFQPVYATAGDIWAVQGNSSPTLEEPTLKVGRYSVEERKNRILKYLKKRNKRNYNKTIKYACRKILADRRVRVRGRFARNNDVCEEATPMKNINNLHEVDYYNDDAQIKLNGEDWLQEAVTNLMYLPIFAG